MAHASRTFRVFVSSTLSDLKAERDALQKEVFPKLREICLAHGCRFQPIDRRRGVSEEAARWAWHRFAFPLPLRQRAC